MKKIAYFVLLSVVSANLYAFELNSLKVSGINERAQITLPAPEAVKVVNIPKTYQYLWMHINNYAAGGAQAYDYSSNIDVTVRRISDGQFDVNSRVDTHYDWAAIQKALNKDYRLSGSGMYLDMNEFNGSYSISGKVTGENNQLKSINLNLYTGMDAFSYSLSGFGINLNIDRSGISGNFDTVQYSKKAISAITSLILARQLDAALNPANP